MTHLTRTLPATLATLLFAGISAGDDAPAAATSSARITNPYVAFAAVRRAEYRGHERNEEGKTVTTRTVSVVLDRTRVITGIRSAVVDVKDYEDGKLIEHTLDYYAQRPNGDVWYLGEDVNDIENGKVVGHDGHWLAGRRGARPGLFMPARPRRGQKFRQERAPGVAEDTSTIVGTERTVPTPGGTFAHCVKTRDYSPLDKASEHKYYCRGVGLVREDVEGGNGLLQNYERTAQAPVQPMDDSGR
jgi:hypothetical protein